MGNKSGTTADDAAPLGAIVGQVKAWVERLGWIWVEAQIIELRRRNAPTQFVTLRDTTSNVSAKMTCTARVLDAAGPLAEGTVVLARLKPQVYAERADLSFECSELQVAGEGKLLAHLEALKRKLQAEGLFDPARKKRLPFLPRCIGLVTGSGSDAERDVLTNARLRWPAVNFLVRYALMQGPSSAADVMQAVAQLDADPRVDVIVIARGGGSMEDLLPLSDEGLVRAVAAARTPVVSAIGHEPDTPILDFVADLRASTPTDAAKRIVPDVTAETAGVTDARARLRRTIVGRVQIEQAWLDQMRSRPAVRDAASALGPHVEQVRLARQRLRETLARRLGDEQRGLDHALAQCRTMSPSSTLRRGYAIATTGGAALTSVTQVAVGAEIKLTLADGGLDTRVERLEADERTPQND